MNVDSDLMRHIRLISRGNGLCSTSYMNGLLEKGIYYELIEAGKTVAEALSYLASLRHDDDRLYRKT